MESKARTELMTPANKVSVLVPRFAVAVVIIEQLRVPRSLKAKSLKTAIRSPPPKMKPKYCTRETRDG